MNQIAANPNHLGGLPTDAAAVAQDTKEAQTRPNEKIKKAAEALSQNKAFQKKAARAAQAAGPPNGEQVDATERSTGAAAAAAAKAKTAVDKDKDKDKGRPRSGTTNEVKKHVTAGGLLEKENALDLISQALSLPEYHGLADEIMAAAYNYVLKNDKSKNPVTEALDFGSKSKKIIYVVSLMAAIGDEKLMETTSPADRDKLQKKLSSLFDPSGSDRSKVSSGDIQAFTADTKVKHDLGELLPGMSLRHIGKMLSSVDDRNENGQKAVYSVIDAAIKANPNDPISALRILQSKAKGLLNTERQPSSSGANFPRLAKLTTDLHQIKLAINILESNKKIYDACIACIDRMPTFENK